MHITSTLSMLHISYMQHGQIFSHSKLNLPDAPGKILIAFLNPPSISLFRHYHSFRDIAWIGKEYMTKQKKGGNKTEKLRAL